MSSTTSPTTYGGAHAVSSVGGRTTSRRGRARVSNGSDASLREAAERSPAGVESQHACRRRHEHRGALGRGPDLDDGRAAQVEGLPARAGAHERHPPSAVTASAGGAFQRASRRISRTEPSGRTTKASPRRPFAATATDPLAAAAMLHASTSSPETAAAGRSSRADVSSQTTRARARTARRPGRRPCTAPWRWSRARPARGVSRRPRRTPRAPRAADSRPVRRSMARTRDTDRPSVSSCSRT